MTGSRADYGLLYWPMRLLVEDDAFELQVVVTGSHLSRRHGETWRQVEEDGFRIAARVDLALAEDTPPAVTRALGRAVYGMADVLEKLRPDLLMLLGDRYEILAVAAAALIAQVPVVHLCGGDLSEGAIDDAVRHAVTKMAHVHCVSNEVAARRVAQLGEDPARIFVTGSPGLDHLRGFKPLPREDFFQRMGLVPRGRTALVTFHPETLGDADPECAMGELLAALDALGPDFGFILTGSNADVAGSRVQRMAGEYAARRDNACFHVSLGGTLYFNALAHADVMVGNSSSGLYEAPSFRLPTVNIGGRQRGRLRAASVVDCEARREAIVSAVGAALALDCRDLVNPYGDGRSAPRIVVAIKGLPPPSSLLRKRFHDIAES